MPGSDAALPRCLGGCGYALSSDLARARGYGHRCWAKLPPLLQASITAEIRPTPPRTPRSRPAKPGSGQIPITPENPVTDSAILANTIRCLELFAASEQAHAAGDLQRCHDLIDQAIDECGADTVTLIRGGMTIGEIPKPDDEAWHEYLQHQRDRLAQLTPETPVSDTDTDTASSPADEAATTDLLRRQHATIAIPPDAATERPCWACRGTGVRITPDPADREFEHEDQCTVCEGSGLADSAGGPIVREPWNEA
jgi:hypothetical protein